MSDLKRVSVPLTPGMKNKLELIGVKQKRNLTSTLEYALEVYAALHHEDGTMKCSIDTILLGESFPVATVTAPISTTTDMVSSINVEEHSPADPINNLLSTSNDVVVEPLKPLM